MYKTESSEERERIKSGLTQLQEQNAVELAQTLGLILCEASTDAVSQEEVRDLKFSISVYMKELFRN